MSVSAVDVAQCSFSVNGRDYSPPPVPIAVICIDGCGDEYLSVSLAQGRMPNRCGDATRRSPVHGPWSVALVYQCQ